MIPFLRPRIVHQNEYLHLVEKIVDSGCFVFGENTSRFEEMIREYCGTKYAVALGNCSQGLILMMSMVDADTVILPAFSFSATWQGVFWNTHLKFAFADVDDSGLLSPETLEPVMKRHPGAAVLAVHMYGNPCDVVGLQEVVDRYRGKLYFDSAHGLGSRHQGQPLGGFGSGEVFSLGVTKCLPCGEGGIFTTNDEKLGEAMIKARIHGKVEDGRSYRSPLDVDIPGLNARPQELNMALGRVLLPSLSLAISKRNEIAQRYIDAFGDKAVTKVVNGNVCSYKDFTIRAGGSLETKVELARRLLKEHSIQTKEYYFPALHNLSSVKVEGNRNLSRGESFPAAEKLAETALALPIYPALTEEQQEVIISAVLKESPEWN